jgi:hypothetical protein
VAVFSAVPIAASGVVVNIFLWVLQVLLALHTVMGAMWKLSNTTDAVPSLKAIPPAAWTGLSVIELACSVALVLPLVVRSLGKLPPIAATIIAAEMVLYIGIHLASGEGSNGQIIYWGVVAVVCAFLAYGRFVLAPLRS